MVFSQIKKKNKTMITLVMQLLKVVVEDKVEVSGGFGGADFSDIFEDFFGDFGGGARSKGRRNYQVIEGLI